MYTIVPYIYHYVNYLSLFIYSEMSLFMTVYILTTTNFIMIHINDCYHFCLFIMYYYNISNKCWKQQSLKTLLFTGSNSCTRQLFKLFSVALPRVEHLQRFVDFPVSIFHLKQRLVSTQRYKLSLCWNNIYAEIQTSVR